jgi:hypothetical protein
MSSDDGEDSRDEEQELVLMKDLFEQEHHDPKGKYVRWEGVYNGVTSNTTRPELNI